MTHIKGKGVTFVVSKVCNAVHAAPFQHIPPHSNLWTLRGLLYAQRHMSFSLDIAVGEHQVEGTVGSELSPAYFSYGGPNTFVLWGPLLLLPCLRCGCTSLGQTSGSRDFLARLYCCRSPTTIRWNVTAVIGLNWGYENLDMFAFLKGYSETLAAPPH